ncbi:MAG TPA: class I SAM-dependent methyltransferase [Chthoniobacterales bacterium]|jgi:2-polyprenyl-3-methyl-5-hydroxy-6-metoxy-1,4-benzoquinol methylase
MRNGNAAAEHERACAQVARRYGELWLRFYVGRKLRSDPIFTTAFGLLGESRETLIDVGCGVGLLPFYLRERGFRAPIVGLDRDGRKIARAREAVGRAGYRDLEFVEENATEISERRGNIVLFDLLHYLPPDEQARLLERLVPRLAPGGMLVIRDCPRDDNARFWLTYLAERFAQTTTWIVAAPLHFPTRELIFSPFPPNEFSRSVEPLWGRTPFNNHLFIFRRRAAAAVPAAEARSDTFLA